MIEVTFEEVRRHLGVATQRRWSAAALRRTTPALLGLFSLVTLYAHPHMGSPGGTVRQAAWYRKPIPPFSDALACIRRELGAQTGFCMSVSAPELVKIRRAWLEHMTDALCYAA